MPVHATKIKVNIGSVNKIKVKNDDDQVKLTPIINTSVQTVKVYQAVDGGEY